MAKAIPTHEQIRSALERLRPLGIRQLRYEVSIACAVAKPILQKCAEVAGVGILQYDAELNAFRVVVQPREV